MRIKVDIQKAVKRLSRSLVTGKSEKVFKDKKQYKRRLKHRKIEEDTDG